MKEFKFNETVDSDDHCIRGSVVFNEAGEAYVAYYTDKKSVELIKIDYDCQFFDWEVVEEKKKKKRWFHLR